MQNCKLVKDKISGLSVGYGFVKYETDDCAQLAIQGMNGKQCGGKRIKVSVARPEGANNKDEKAALFIGGMPKSFTEADLQSMFATYGLVEEVKIFSDTNTGVSRAGSAFVRMDSAGSARSVIAALNGKPMQGGTTLTVKEFTPRSKQGGDGNLFSALEGSQIQSYAVFPAAFEQAGYGQQAAYDQLAAYGGYAPSALDPYTAGGYGAADYAAQAASYAQQGYGAPQAAGYDPAQAAAAAAAAAQAGYGYPQVPGYGAPPQAAAGFVPAYGQAPAYGAQPRQPSFAQNRFNPMGSRPQPQAATGGQTGVDANNNTLFIFHLPTETSEDGLRQMFANFGSIVDISVVRNKDDGTSRGFGFVTFSSHKEAQSAMDAMNGHQVGGKFLKVSFKK